MELDVRKLKTYVISLKDSDHRSRISKMLDDLGFEDWEFFDAIKSTPHFSYIVGCGLSHSECVSLAKFPCLVLEDDAAITEWYNPVIEIPDDADIFYLGTSAWGMKTGTSTLNGSDFQHVDSNIFRVRHMNSTHSMIYINENNCKKIAHGSIRYMAETGNNFDEAYGIQQNNYKAYCFENPSFYQDCPKNAIFTQYPVTTVFRMKS